MSKPNIIEMTEAGNIFEARARLKKAQALAAALREAGAASTDGLSEATWRLAEKAAGQHEASDITRRITRRIMFAAELGEL